MICRLIRLSLVAAIASALLATSDVYAQASGPLGVRRQVGPFAATTITMQTAEGKRSNLPVVIGALAGAGIGAIALFAQSDCRRVESMCGLAIPLYVGGGALLGGAIGYVWSRR